MLNKFFTKASLALSLNFKKNRLYNIRLVFLHEPFAIYHFDLKHQTDYKNESSQLRTFS